MQFNLRKTKTDYIKEQAEIEQKQKREEIEKLKFACWKVFNDENGLYILKFLKRICKWEDSDTNINHDQIIYDKGRRQIWTILRTVLPKKVLAEIEIYDENALIN